MYSGGHRYGYMGASTGIVWGQAWVRVRVSVEGYSFFETTQPANLYVEVHTTLYMYNYQL